MPRPARKNAGRRPRNAKPLDREKIAAAALDLAREGGEGALSMRRVAGALGVDVAALYRHYRNKDELLSEVARVVSDSVELPAATDGTWQERILELTGAIRHRIVSHPEIGLFGGGSPGATPFIAKANAALATVLYDAGLRDAELLFAAQAILHQVTAIAESEVMLHATAARDNRAFALSIYEQLPEQVREVWPRPNPKARGHFDFDEFFAFAMRGVLRAIDPD